tara:strand:+ start:809 stop:970 length:162 start_codon:yes stop_codon:yes gene_type:complete
MDKVLSQILEMIETIDEAISDDNEQDTENAIYALWEYVHNERKQAWLESVLSM